jgi:hypothetical protein
MAGQGGGKERKETVRLIPRRFVFSLYWLFKRGVHERIKLGKHSVIVFL